MEATRKALTSARLTEDALNVTCAGLGLAGANVDKHRDAFATVPLPFCCTALRSDAETACLGAHGGADGAILILGTGSQGVVCRSGVFATIGGWGFHVSDGGSGALLGRAAVRRALLAKEGIETSSPLTEAILARFGHDCAAVVEWAGGAQPRDWASFARLVFAHAEWLDDVALDLVRASAAVAERMIERLIGLGASRIALMGGLAQPTRQYLSTRVAAALVEPQGDAMDGALLLAERAIHR